MSELKITGTDFIVMHVKDFAEAVKFYEEVLGLKFSKKYGRIPGGELETGNLTIQMFEASAIGQEFTRSQAVAFHVKDVDAARKALESRGVSFVPDTMDSGFCYQAYFKDPSGNPLIIHNRYASAG